MNEAATITQSSAPWVCVPRRPTGAGQGPAPAARARLWYLTSRRGLYQRALAHPGPLAACPKSAAFRPFSPGAPPAFPPSGILFRGTFPETSMPARPSGGPYQPLPSASCNPGRATVAALNGADDRGTTCLSACTLDFRATSRLSKGFKAFGVTSRRHLPCGQAGNSGPPRIGKGHGHRAPGSAPEPPPRSRPTPFTEVFP